MAKPTGLSARFSAGWAYLSVPSGPDVQVEALLNGVWTSAHRYGAEYLVQMYSDGRATEWRARYGSTGEWTTGRVSYPDTFVEDGGSGPGPTPPAPDVTPATPTGLTVAKQGDVYKATWQPAAGASFYRVQLKVSGATAQKVTEPGTEFIGLAPASYTFGVVAVAQNAEGFEFVSKEATATFTVDKAPTPPTPDPIPEPTPPKRPANVRAHCISHQSAKIEWDRDPGDMRYTVTVHPYADAAIETQSTLVTATGLKPSTSYTAHVVSHNAAGTSEPGVVEFRTGLPEPAPDPDPDVETGADYDAPELMVWPLENGRVRASWTDPAEGRSTAEMGYPFWHVSLDQRTWYFTRDRMFEFEVAAGTEVMVSVYGVWDNKLTAIATKGVAL